MKCPYDTQKKFVVNSIPRSLTVAVLTGVTNVLHLKRLSVKLIAVRDQQAVIDVV
jgi:xanthine/uracil/vitamin C permease (AzgA family)